jgi:uncharacterized protein YbjT (DUF2867 family)
MLPSKPGDSTSTNDDLYCADLPSAPLTSVGTVLVTGASGYIGGRLVPELLARGYRVRVMVRGDAEVYRNLWPEVEVAVADALDRGQLAEALKEIDTAYYLIHSLQLGPWEFEGIDACAAANFRHVAEKVGLKRIIYLGGPGDIRKKLSSHLRSRIEVANELRSGSVPVTELRAAIIIGSGSASYEMMLHLVKRLRFIPVPSWASNRCQPIGIRGIIKYLVGCLEVVETAGQEFSVGGHDVMTYREMLQTFGEILNRKIRILPSPITSPGFYAYVVNLLTPVPGAIAHCLIEGLRHDVVSLDDSIKRYLDIKPFGFREAVVRALSREEQDRVSTRWSDAYPPAHELALRLEELGGQTTFVSQHKLESYKSAKALFASVCRVGGKDGWFDGNWIWKLRGALDRLLTGVGSSRGRRSYSKLRANDVIDFWRIEEIHQDRRLLLRAEMKIPGRAWLQFRIDDLRSRRHLSVTAYHDARSLAGKAYWYACLPFHYFVFRKLIEEIERRA